MDRNWTKTTLDAFINFQNGKFIPTGEIKASGEFEVYGSNGVIGFSDKKNNTDVSVIGRVGAYCGAIHRSKKSAWVTENAIVASNKDNSDSDYIYYLLNNLSLERMAIGSAQPLLTQSGLKAIETVLPPLYVQRQIAVILSAFDAKIKVNEQMNYTLEQMARALFKSWFVDFDPVRAKMRGEQPAAMDTETAALFPDELVEVEGREVPRGWEASELGVIMDLDKGLSYKGAFLSDVGVPMINLGTFFAGSGFKANGLKFYSGEYKPKHVVAAGDIVVANTDLTQKREIIGSPAIVPRNIAAGDVIFTHHTFAVRNKGIVGQQFIYHLMQMEDYRARVVGHAHGTTVLALPKESLLALEFVLPSPNIVAQFCNQADSLFAKIEQNEAEAIQLAQLRDSLLPRLLSGELDVTSWVDETEQVLA